MANEIKLKRGSGSDPGTSDLSVGEVAIRTDNGKLFTKRDNGTVTEITGGGGIDDGDKGDITVSNSGATFTIDDQVVTTAKLANDAVTQNKIADDSVGTAQLVNGGVSSVKIGSDAITGAKIADDSIDSEHYVDGSIDTAHIADDQVTYAKIQNVSATDRILGRDSSGAGVIEEITPANLRTMINVEDGATADQSASEIVALIADQTIAPSTIDMEDDERIKLGASDDLLIYHDGSTSYIQDAGTGQLKILSNQLLIQNAAGDANQIICTESGSVDLHHNGNKKFETSSSGIHVTGDVSITGDYLADDDEKLKMGDGFDLQIYHDGSNSYVQDTGTGNLKLLGSTVQIGKSDNSEIGLTFTSDGSIQLRHDNSTKFETSSSGGTITGTLVADGFTGPLTGNVTGNASGSSGSCTGNAATATALETARTIAGVSFDGSANISLNNNAITNGAGYITDVVNDTSPQLGGDLASNGNNIKFGDSSDGSSDDVLSFGAGDDLLIYHYSDSSYIQDNGTGPLQIYTNGTDIRFKTSDGETMTKMVKDGGVELYHNASLKCQTTSSGINVAGSIAVSGNVDGRDVAADGTKLDGIASGATNVTNNNQLTNGAGYLTSVGTSNIADSAITTGKIADGAIVDADINNSANIAGSKLQAASGSNAGSMSASDKSKLDGIAAGATVGLPTSGGELTGDLITHEVRPDGNNSRSLGTSSARWSNVFTNDLHLSNKGGSNKVDNTWGDFTIQEGIEDLFLINNRNGKMFKFVLQEVN